MKRTLPHLPGLENRERKRAESDGEEGDPGVVAEPSERQAQTDDHRCICCEFHPHFPATRAMKSDHDSGSRRFGLMDAGLLMMKCLTALGVTSRRPVLLVVPSIFRRIQP